MDIHLHGFFYSMFLDPLLRRVRQDLAEMIPCGSSVLEIASGTGDQARMLADRGCDVAGIDLDPAMTAYAAGRATRRSGASGALEFRTADARDTGLPSDSRDYAAVTLALHAMPGDVRQPVLMEMKRVAPILVLADYTTPLPRSFGGILSVSIERLAGGEHYAGFRSYRASGGLAALIEDSGLVIRERHVSLGGVVDIVIAD